MGRIATVAIIALALGGATAESFAQTPPQPPVSAAGAAQSGAHDDGSPMGALLADADTPGAPNGGVDGQMQPPPPPHGQPPMGFGGPGGPGGPDGPGMMRPPGFMPGFMPRFVMERMRHMEATWGLFFNQRDKNLSNADVQVLAQAILLMHGNHDWKVIDVADSPDGRAAFAYGTADGSVIARFVVDRHNGHLQRVG